MSKRIILLSAVALNCLLPVSAQAADETVSKLDTIVIVGSRLEQTATEIGTSVSVITAEEIDSLGYDFAVDAVASAPGVTINQNGSYGGTATVRIRGAASEQTLVLIDGIVVNDTTSPGGGFDFARLDTSNIAQIEVLKGPQSTLWGTDAIGGVVSIITKRPEDGFGGALFGEYGSYNTFSGGASLAGASNRGDFRLALTNTSSDGISKADEANGNDEKDGYESYTMSGRGSLALGPDARLELNLHYTEAEADFDSFSFTSQGFIGDGDEASETEELSGQLAFIFSALDDRLDNQLLMSYADIDRQNFNAGSPSFGAEGDRKAYRYQGTYTFNPRHKTAFGIEREDIEANGLETSIDGIFGLHEFKASEALTLTGGLRVDDHEDFGSKTTGRIAAAFNPNSQMTLRTSWGQGFKAPTIFQGTFFCCGADAPNPDLEPETSEAFDLGLDWRSSDGKLELGATYFSQDIKNLINFSAGTYFNVAEVETSGIELYGDYQMAEWLNISASYAIIDAEDKSIAGQLARIPERSGDVTFAVTPTGPLSGALHIRYNGDENDANGEVAAWTRIDASAGYDISETVELFVRVENLFDEEYQQVLGYGTPGTSGSVGFRFKY
ncbi:MAG: Vitamin B12 transporter BtuB [Hyphomonas sp. TMED17]|nr:MAG: Vitamin B12 transporter BtuB [Hyphomonas sp. TMED17]